MYPSNTRGIILLLKSIRDRVLHHVLYFFDEEANESLKTLCEKPDALPSDVDVDELFQHLFFDDDPTECQCLQTRRMLVRVDVCLPHRPRANSHTKHREEILRATSLDIRIQHKTVQVKSQSDGGHDRGFDYNDSLITVFGDSFAANSIHHRNN